MAIRVLIWNEFLHEKKEERIAKIYPNGIHGALAEYLSQDPNLIVKTATLDSPDHGLSQQELDETDVLIWWGHMGHKFVTDEEAERIRKRVVEGGMGFIGMHSAHMSKPFRLLMGTSCTLRWHCVNEKERVWNIMPQHPIAKGIPPYFEIPHEELYGERFDIPQPDELVFISWFESGEVFRSGCCYNRGYGRIFYFQPGHESFPNFYNPVIRKVLHNAVYWANPVFEGAPVINGDKVACLEEVKSV